MINAIKKIEKPKLSVIFLCLSFFSIFFNPGMYHSLLYSLPFYALFCITEYIEFFLKNKKIKPIHIGIKETLLLLFMAVTIFNCIFVESGKNAIKVTCYYIGVVIATLVILNADLNKKDIKFIINSYVTSVILIVVVMMIQKVTRSGDVYRYSIASLINGVVKDTNFLAAYMSVPVVILAIKGIFGNKNRILNLIFCIFCFGGVFATGSRSALIFLMFSFVILFAYYIYINKSKKIIKKLLTIGTALIIVAIILIQFIPEVFIERYFTNSYKDGSNIARFAAWKAGINIFLNNPITGKGVESQYRLGRFYGIKYQMYTHSTYVDLIADYGMMGICTLGLLLIIMIAENLSPEKWLILAILVNNLGTSAIISSLYVAYFWQNIILVLLLDKYIKNNPDTMYDIFNIENKRDSKISEEVECEKNKISIILPVYNSEETIRETINSVLDQTYKNIELIVVNDGSTDESEKICKQIEINNKDVMKFFSIKNSGVSNARNFGIEKSTGEYITFIDSDDKYDKNYIKYMLNELINNDGDIITCGYKTFGRSENTFRVTSTQIYNNENAQYIGKLQENQLFNQIWHKLYKTNIIKETNIKFDGEIDLGEDYIFNLKYMKYVQKAIAIADVLYFYRVKDNGLNYKYRADKFEIEYSLLKNMESCFIENNYTNMEPVYIQYVKTYFNGILYIFDKNNRIKYSERLKQLDNFISQEQYIKDLEYVRKKIKSKKYKTSIDNMLKGKIRVYILMILYKLRKWSRT